MSESTQPHSQRSPRRLLRGALIPLIFALVWTHALVGAARAWAAIPYEELTESSFALSLSALFVGAMASGSRAPLQRRLVMALLAAALSLGVIGSLNPVALLPGLALLPVAALTAWLAHWVERRTPTAFTQSLARSPGWRVVWIASSLLAVVQLARLSTYVSNPESEWFLTTSNAFFAKHECANAYVYAAELNQRGETDVYDPIHYPGLNPQAEPQTQMQEMAPEDPFQYPPPFLMLPALAISITHDYPAIRSVWFALNVTLCLGSVLLFSLWAGRATRYRSLLLAPVAVVAFPVLHNFQYGQFHFAAVALAVLGMLAMEKRRSVLGAALLAAAITAKVFPIFLVVALFGQKRFADVARVLSFGLLYAVLGVIVLGAGPYSAFFTQHLPRLSSGAAFAFGEAWPEVADLLVAGNQGISGMVAKVEAFGGVTWPSRVASSINLLYALLLLCVTWFSARAVGKVGAPAKAGFWIGVLGLGSLASAGAWADYVPLTGVWAMVFLIPTSRERSLHRGLLLVSGFLQLTLLGTVPLGPFAEAWWMLPLSFVSGLSLLFILGSAAAAPLMVRRRALSEGRLDSPAEFSLIPSGGAAE